jgi:hypothetical protein
MKLKTSNICQEKYIHVFTVSAAIFALNSRMTDYLTT